MTEENRRANARDELARAATALKAADVLHEQGLESDAVSRLYYHVLYHIRALLLTKGLEARSHDGVSRLFGLHFVKERVFPPQSAHVLAKLMKYRQEADYDPVHPFTAQDFVELRQEAGELTDRVRAHLAQTGFL